MNSGTPKLWAQLALCGGSHGNVALGGEQFRRSGRVGRIHIWSSYGSVQQELAGYWYVVDSYSDFAGPTKG